MTPAQRICARLRDEFTHKKMSHRFIAERLTEHTGQRWTQPTVTRILNGKVQLTVTDLFLLATIAGLSPVELVRDPQHELVADLTPSELRVFTAMRDHPAWLQLIATVVGEAAPRPHSIKTRRELAAAQPKKRKPWS